MEQNSFSEAVTALLDGRNFGQLATVDSAGRPHIDTVWVLREGDEIVVASTLRTEKARNLARCPHAYLVVLNADNPYEQAQIALTLARTLPDPDLKVCDRIAAKYTGRPFPQRNHPDRVALVFSPGKVRYHRAHV